MALSPALRNEKIVEVTVKHTAKVSEPVILANHYLYPGETRRVLRSHYDAALRANPGMLALVDEPTSDMPAPNLEVEPEPHDEQSEAVGETQEQDNDGDDPGEPGVKAPKRRTRK
jgi:hypothetical protein